MASEPKATQVSLPVAAAIAILSSAATAGISYGTSVQRISSAEGHGARLEKRIDKLEDAISEMRPMLERIDERTERMVDKSKDLR